MTKYFLWLLLSSATGRPILSAVVLLGGWWALDHATFGMLPSPFRFIRRLSRELTLRRQRSLNPHDRRAAAELAELLLARRRYAEPLALLRANLEAGDEDPLTLFLMSIACYGAGHPDQGEQFFTALEDAAPNFRMDAVDLERGRWRLTHGEAKAAREALERLCHARPGTVEGQVLLARAYAQEGQATQASAARKAAWDNFIAAPRFQRRRDRFWAWRARPSRPLLYAAALVLAGLFVRQVIVPAFSSTPAPAILRSSTADDDS